jgi:hypothetical protein
MMDDYFTWDLLLKNIPKLPSLEIIFLLKKEEGLKYKSFYEKNKWIYNPPFLVFYNPPSHSQADEPVDQHIVDHGKLKVVDNIPNELNLANFTNYLSVPHTEELQRLFE